MRNLKFPLKFFHRHTKYLQGDKKRKIRTNYRVNGSLKSRRAFKFDEFCLSHSTVHRWEWRKHNFQHSITPRIHPLSSSPSPTVYQKQHPSLCRKIRYHPYKRHFPKRTQILLSNYPTQPPTRCYIIHNKNRLCCSILLLPIPCNIIVANLFNLPYSNIMHFVDHLFHSTALLLHKCS